MTDVFSAIDGSTSGGIKRLNQIAKVIANAVAVCIVVAPTLCYWLEALVVGPGRAFPGWSQLFSLVPGNVGICMRRAFYRLVLPSCGRDSCISFGTVFSHPTARLGDRVYVGVGCMLGDVTLDDDVLIGSHVSIINGRRQHGIDRLDIPVREQPGEYPHVVIGKDVWIGDRSVVAASAGDHSVIGTGSVVTKPVPDFAIVAGVPAHIVGWRHQITDIEHEMQERQQREGVST